MQAVDYNSDADTEVIETTFDDVAGALLALRAHVLLARCATGSIDTSGIRRTAQNLVHTSALFANGLVDDETYDERVRNASSRYLLYADELTKCAILPSIRLSKKETIDGFSDLILEAETALKVADKATDEGFGFSSPEMAPKLQAMYDSQRKIMGTIYSADPADIKSQLDRIATAWNKLSAMSGKTQPLLEVIALQKACKEGLTELASKSALIGLEESAVAWNSEKRTACAHHRRVLQNMMRLMTIDIPDVDAQPGSLFGQSLLKASISQANVDSATSETGEGHNRSSSIQPLTEWLSSHRELFVRAAKPDAFSANVERDVNAEIPRSVPN